MSKQHIVATNLNKCIRSYKYLNLKLQITIAVRHRSIYDHFMYMTVHFMPCSFVLSRQFITCALWTRLDLYSYLPPTNQRICSAYEHICLLQYMYVHYKLRYFHGARCVVRQEGAFEHTHKHTHTHTHTQTHTHTRTPCTHTHTHTHTHSTLQIIYFNHTVAVFTAVK